MTRNEKLEEALIKALNENERSKTKLKESYTAREQFEASMQKYSEEDRANIKVVVETTNYLLTVARDSENPNRFYLAITTGSVDSRFLPDIYIDQDYKGKCEKVNINWSAFGDCSIEETNQFIDYLKEAIEFANKIDGKDFSNEL